MVRNGDTGKVKEYFRYWGKRESIIFGQITKLAAPMIKNRVRRINIEN
jgi:hypothetical protein